MRRETEKSIFMPIAICALILSLLLILFSDAARLFSKRSEALAEVQILLEGMDKETAEALASETAFSMDGVPCGAVSIGEAEPQAIRTTTRDGRILLLPSARLFCASLVLHVSGEATEDGFLAGKSRRLLVGSRIRIEGRRIAAQGLLLSVTAKVPEGAKKSPHHFSLFNR